MSREYENLKQRWDTRWTPMTDEVRGLIEDAIKESGQPRRRFADEVGIRQRHLRRLLNIRPDGTYRSKGISLKLLDKILCRSSFSYRMHDLPWYTAAEMEQIGVWKPQFGDEETREGYYAKMRARSRQELGDALSHSDGDAILGEHLDEWTEE